MSVVRALAGAVSKKRPVPPPRQKFPTFKDASGELRYRKPDGSTPQVFRSDGQKFKSKAPKKSRPKQVDPAPIKLSDMDPKALDSLQKLAAKNEGKWSSVVQIPANDVRFLAGRLGIKLVRRDIPGKPEASGFLPISVTAKSISGRMYFYADGALISKRNAEKIIGSRYGIWKGQVFA